MVAVLALLIVLGTVLTVQDTPGKGGSQHDSDKYLECVAHGGSEQSCKKH